MATEIIFPRVDMDMTSGRIGRWLATEGSQVTSGEPLFEIETDKAAMEIEAPASGTLRGVQATEGLEVQVGAVVAWIVAEGEAWQGLRPCTPLVLAAPDPRDSGDAGLEAPPAAGSGAEPQLRATPLARREAKRRGLDLVTITGSGPRGRIVSGDLPAGAAIHRRWLGLPTGTPIVFLHGFGADLSAWRGVWTSLEASHRMLVVDLPGHGASPVPQAATFDALVDAVQAVLDEEGVSHLHLVGHSLGGAVALALADAGTLDLRSLSLLAPAGLGPDINGDFLLGFARAEREASMAPWLAMLFADPGHVTPSFVRAVVRSRDETTRHYQRALIDQLFPDGTQAISLRHALAGLAVPSKIIWGHEDCIIPARHGRGLPPRVGLHLCASGHQPQVEQPALVAALVHEAVRAGE